MSNKAVNWAFEAPIENTGAKFVLVVLADHAGDHSGENWTCFPSIERIQRHTAQGFRTVQRHLDWLEGEGWITRRARVGRRGSKAGAYDYTLHRDRLSPAKLAGEQTGQIGAEHRPISTTSPANLASANIEEPPIEPPPELGAGEVDQDFEAVFEAWAALDPFHTSHPLALAEWQQFVDGIGAARLRAAAMRYLAEDPDVRRHGPKWLHKWLSEELFRPLLPREGQQLKAAQQPWTRTPFACPEVRAAVVAEKGEDWTASWLDPSCWDADQRVITPARRIAFKTLSAELRKLFTALSVTVAEPIASI